MPFFITAFTRSATLNKTTGEKKQNKRYKKTYFTAKLKHLNLKAPTSNNVKIQSIRRKLNYTRLFFRYYKAYGALY